MPMNAPSVCRSSLAPPRKSDRCRSWDSSAEPRCAAGWSSPLRWLREARQILRRGISSDTSLSATSEPKRFSTRSKEIPTEFTDGARSTGCTFARGSSKAIRSASDQVAQRRVNALALARVVVFADRAGLATQFEAEEIVLQFVEAAANFAVNFSRNRARGSCRRLGRCL